MAKTATKPSSRAKKASGATSNSRAAQQRSAALTWPGGFRFAAGLCGIKKSGSDLAVVTTDQPVACAAVFTTNRLQAAPVRLSRKNLESTGGYVRAIVVNSGNANCATGKAGMQAAQSVMKATAAALDCRPQEVFICSTGVIGVPLPYEKINAALPTLLQQNDGAEAVAQAILTTDTRTKIAHTVFLDGQKQFIVAGYCKGSGMIHPRMATMLGFIYTDAALTPVELRKALAEAVGDSFNRITVDGDTSTNDTVTLAASGAAGKLTAAGKKQFQAALNEVAQSLARQIVLDGEGARKFVTIQVENARTAADADRIARAIAHSPLVKTALAGADANWGRVLAAAGYSGVNFDPEKAEVWFNDLEVYHQGLAVPFDETAAKKMLSEAEVLVRVNLRAGKASGWMWTCDLTEEYIRINGSYRS